MANLNLQTFFQILEQQAAAMASSTTLVNDFSVGSFTRALLEATSSIALWNQANTVQVLAAERLATSVGEDVDSYVADFDLFRLQAVDATGSVTFSRYSANGSALLAPGAQVVTLDGSQSYTVTVDTTNPAWNAAQGAYLIANGVSSLTVPVVAVNAGTQGNVLAATIGLIQSATPFDTVTNALPLTNGIDEETDAALKARFAVYVNTRSLATDAAIQYAATSIQPGLTCYVAENINTAGVFTPGNFVVTVDDGSGEPPASLIAAVSAAVNATRAATINYAVQPPTVISAIIELTITVGTGYTKSVLQPLVETAIINFISLLPVGVTFPYSMIANIAYNTSPGITNVTAISLNGATADIGGGQTQVVRVGSVTVN